MVPLSFSRSLSSWFLSRSVSSWFLPRPLTLQRARTCEGVYALEGQREGELRVPLP